MSMFQLPIQLGGPPNILGQIVNVALPTAVDPFPTQAYDDPLEGASANAGQLQTALNNAIQTVGKGATGLNGNVLKMPFTIADISGSAKFPTGETLPIANQSYYIASEAKIGIMYAAFEFLAMAKRFLAFNPVFKTLPPQSLFSAMESKQNPQFMNSAPLLSTGTISADQMKPIYANILKLDGGAVDFTDTFNSTLARVVVLSNDAPDTTTLIRGMGYRYLNGALIAGGFFNGTDGIWLGSDYSFGAHGESRVIHSINDGMATLTGTTHQMAKMLALIYTNVLVDKGACQIPVDNQGAGSSAKMQGLLGRAASELCCFTTENRISQAKFTYNKVGFGPLNAGGTVNSQVTVIKNPVADGHTYVISWQNLVTADAPCGHTGVDVAHPVSQDVQKVVDVILSTITAYETAIAAPAAVPAAP